MEKIIVAPSILSANFAQLGQEINKVEEAGADWIHVDVMDGHFVPNLTMGPPVVKSLRPVTKLPLDVHLMIENPEKYISDFAKAGSNYLTVHIETLKDPHKCFDQIRSEGMKLGLTSRPSTNYNKIKSFIKELDLVLVMTVEPGFSGQSFMAEQIEKIKLVHQEIQATNSKALIEVDGGINETTGKLCYEAGARVFVAGNYIFKNDYKKSISSLKSIGS